MLGMAEACAREMESFGVKGTPPASSCDAVQKAVGDGPEIGASIVILADEKEKTQMQRRASETKGASCYEEIEEGFLVFNAKLASQPSSISRIRSHWGAFVFCVRWSSSDAASRDS